MTSPNGSEMHLATQLDSPSRSPTGKPFAAMRLEGGLTLRFKPPISQSLSRCTPSQGLSRHILGAKAPAVFHVP